MHMRRPAGHPVRRHRRRVRCPLTAAVGPVTLIAASNRRVTKLRLRRVTADETTFVEWVGQFDVADADEAEVCNSVMSLYHEGLEALRVRFAAS